MTISYLDTSAAMKLVVEEAETDALAHELSSGRDLIASWLLHTELHRAAGRHSEAVAADTVNRVLATVNLVDLTRGDMLAAGTLTPLRSNDAIHLAVALRLGVDEIVTYDTEQIDAARNAGMIVVVPGTTGE